MRAIDITDWAKANGPSEFCDAAVWIEIVVGSAIGVLNGYPASYDGKIRPLDQHGNPVVPGDDKV